MGILRASLVYLACFDNIQVLAFQIEDISRICKGKNTSPEPQQSLTTILFIIKIRTYDTYRTKCRHNMHTIIVPMFGAGKVEVDDERRGLIVN